MVSRGDIELKSLSQSQRDDFDIALSACKYNFNFEAHSSVGTKLWSDPKFVLELVKYEYEQFLKNGEEDTVQVDSLIFRCPDDMRQGIYLDLITTNEAFYGSDGHGSGWTTKEGYIHEYEMATKSLEAIIELNSQNISCGDSSPLQIKARIDLVNKLQNELSSKQSQSTTKRIKI